MVPGEKTPRNTNNHSVHDMRASQSRAFRREFKCTSKCLLSQPNKIYEKVYKKGVIVDLLRVLFGLILPSDGAGRSSGGRESPPVKVSIFLLILLSRPICSLRYFSYEPVVHNRSIKGGGLCCPDRGKLHIKDPLLLIRKSSPPGASGFPLKTYDRITICLTSNSR